MRVFVRLLFPNLGNEIIYTKKHQRYKMTRCSVYRPSTAQLQARDRFTLIWGYMIVCSLLIIFLFLWLWNTEHQVNHCYFTLCLSVKLDSLVIIYIYIISSKKRSLCTKICIYGFIFTNIPLKTNTELKLNVMPGNIHLSFKSIYLSVPDEDYSRNVSYTLHLISTFLFSKFI